MPKLIVLFKYVDFDIASYIVSVFGEENVLILTKALPSDKKFAKLKKLMICDEEIFPRSNLKNLLKNKSSDEGWVFQQILKYQAVLAQNEEVVTILDGDTVLRACLDFTGDTLYHISRKPDQRYSDFIRLALNLDEEEQDLSRNFISNHMTFKRSYLQNLLDKLEDLHHKNWFESLCIFHNRDSGACLSEYQLYAHYVQRYKNLKTENVKVFRRMDLLNVDLLNGLDKYDLVAFEKYHKKGFVRKRVAEFRYLFGIDWS